jgi:hypothetical protein
MATSYLATESDAVMCFGTDPCRPRMKILAAILAAALSIGTASAQTPIGQVPGYFQLGPAWSPPVTGHPAPYIPSPQSSYTAPPVYSAPVTGTVNRAGTGYITRPQGPGY